MKTHNVTVPEIALIGGTRAMAGAGLALLLGDCLTAEKRKAVGWTLLAVGLFTTIPLAAQVLCKSGCCKRDSTAPPAAP